MGDWLYTETVLNLILRSIGIKYHGGENIIGCCDNLTAATVSAAVAVTASAAVFESTAIN